MQNGKIKSISDNTSRNYGIDLLRIVSMFMVVILHIVGTGGIINKAAAGNFWIAWFFEIAAFCAVNCYALISGYVGVYSKYKISNYAYLWCQVAFYSILITAAFLLIFRGNADKSAMLDAFLPVFSKRYWYFTAYTILFLFIPVLNSGLERLSKRQVGLMLSVLITCVCVIQPLTNYFWKDVFFTNNGYSAWWLIILYLLGGYIRKYGLFEKIKSKRTGFFISMYFLSVLVTFLSKFLLETFSARIFGKTTGVDILINYQSVTMLSAAVFLVLAFENIGLNGFWIKIISFFSPLAFGVYLIHVHPLVFGNFIDNKFSQLANFPAYQMIILILGFAVGIYLTASIIDFLRFKLFKILKLKERFLKAEQSLKSTFFKTND